jgi:hypothetical protein
VLIYNAFTGGSAIATAGISTSGTAITSVVANISGDGKTVLAGINAISGSNTNVYVYKFNGTSLTSVANLYNGSTILYAPSLSYDGGLLGYLEYTVGNYISAYTKTYTNLNHIADLSLEMAQYSQCPARGQQL